MIIDMVKQLARVERDMDSGAVKHVVYDGKRYAFPDSTMEMLELENGQNVSRGLLTSIMEINIQNIQTMIELQKITKEAGES